MIHAIETGKAQKADVLSISKIFTSQFPLHLSMHYNLYL
jgi:hypothetical protein